MGRTRRSTELAQRFGLGLPVERARARMTAYVYGNILVLAAVATATPHSVEDGHAAVAVLATTVTTYLAHVVSHAVGGSIGRDLTRPQSKGEGRGELRDAVPIISSGSVPAILLAIAWWGGIDADRAILLATLAVVVRLAGMGLLAARVSGFPPSGRQLWAGVVLAAASAVIVVLKVWLTH